MRGQGGCIPEAVAGPMADSLVARVTDFSRSGRAAMAAAVVSSTSSALFCLTSSLSRGRNFPLCSSKVVHF